jgi:GNAT superfamily N-acetyltransferase
MEDIKITSLQPSEWKKYKDLRLRALKEDPQAFSSTYEDNLKLEDKVWKQLLEKSLKGESQWYLFAKKDEQLIGMVGAFTEEEKDTAIVIAMYVVKEQRGKGISKQLMNGIISQVQKNKTIKKISLRVSTGQPVALNLYKGLGFKEFKKEKIILGDGEERVICYLEKALR